MRIPGPADVEGMTKYVLAAANVASSTVNASLLAELAALQAALQKTQPAK